MHILVGLALAVYSQPSQPAIPLNDWVPAMHDVFVADTQSNIGYLVHEDGSFLQTPIGSGKKQTVRYIGRTYNAATPVGIWTIKDKSIKGDHITFGKSGLFLRLFKNGDDYTAYGIHATGNINKLLTWNDRYQSMGCILVSDEVLEILEKTYELNGDTLDVVTINGLDEQNPLLSKAN